MITSERPTARTDSVHI